MNDTIHIKDLTVVGCNPSQFEQLKQALAGHYVQWTETFYFPIKEISEIEIDNMIKDTKSPFYSFNMKSLNEFFINLEEDDLTN